ncbi:glycosyltransferase [Paenibacillus sp. DMB20]|nr:glycosyltransferase [Paenibacillus sp. DMB20]
MKRVQVLLSAYNGELYIAEQLKSIMGQSWPQVTVLVRDDGSTDGTVDVVKRTAVEHPGRVELIQGSNLGVVGSFF